MVSGAAGGGNYVIPFESISIDFKLGNGEFGVVQQGVWTNPEGERVSFGVVVVARPTQGVWTNPEGVRGSGCQIFPGYWTYPEGGGVVVTGPILKERGLVRGCW